AAFIGTQLPLHVTPAGKARRTGSDPPGCGPPRLAPRTSRSERLLQTCATCFDLCCAVRRRGFNFLPANAFFVRIGLHVFSQGGTWGFRPPATCRRAGCRYNGKRGTAASILVPMQSIRPRASDGKQVAQ